MMTRTISALGVNEIQLTATSAVNAANIALPALSTAINILCIEGYCGGTANTQYFLQLHNAQPLTTVTVPLKTWQVLGADGFTFNRYDIGLQCSNLQFPATVQTNSFWVAVSTTSGVYTSPAFSNCDLSVEIEEFEQEVADTTSTGLQSDITSYQVVADAASTTKKLIALFAQEVNGMNSYIQLFAAAPTANVSIPILQFPLVMSGFTYQKFGSEGKSFFSQDPNGTGHYGIFVGISQTSGVYDATGQANIIALYK